MDLEVHERLELGVAPSVVFPKWSCSQACHVLLQIYMCIMGFVEKEKCCRYNASLQTKIVAFRRKEKKEKKL